MKAHRRPDLHQIVPEHIALAAVAEEYLVSELARPSGPRNDKRHAVPVIFHKTIIFELGRLIAEGGAENVARTRPLKLQRRDVGFADGHIHAGTGGHAACPEQHIAVRDRQPEMILGQLQQDRVVDDAAILVGDQHIFALAYLAAGKVTATEELGEFRRVWTGDLDLALDRHITQDRFVHEVPEILDRVAKVARNIHVVIDRKSLRAPAQRRIRKGGFTDLGAETETLERLGSGI